MSDHLSSQDDLWHAVDRVLAAGSPERAHAHGLGPLEAQRLRRIGKPVPEALATEARLASFAMSPCDRSSDGFAWPVTVHSS